MQKIVEFVCEVKKFPNDYTKTEIKAIKDMTDPKYSFDRYGTHVFKNLIYAGDIDLSQVVPINKIENSMKYVLKKLIKNNYIIGDIKAGIKPDLFYLYQNLGILKNGIITGYEPENIMKYAKIKNIKSLIKIPLNYNLSLMEWLKIYNEIHDVLTIRWRPKNIFDGFIIIDGIKYVLSDVIKFSSDKIALNKIDAYFMENNRLREITNVFSHVKTSFKSPIKVYDIKMNLLTFMTPEKENLVKALKRAFTMSRTITEFYSWNQLYKITPIMVSPINKLNTYSTDLGVILDILKVNELKKYKNVFLIHLENLLKRINDNKDYDLSEIAKKLSLAISNIDNENLFIDILKNIRKDILYKTNNLAKKYININNIDLNFFIP